MAAPAAAGPKPWRLTGPSQDSGTGDVLIHVLGSGGDLRNPPTVRVTAQVDGKWKTFIEGSPDGAGNVFAASVPPGRAVVSARTGSLKRTLVVDVVAGRTMEIDFSLPRGVPVEGVVRSAAQGPLPGVQLTLESFQSAVGDPGWSDYVMATTDSAGMYRFAEVPTGRWIVAFSGGALGPTSKHRATLSVDGSGPVVHDFMVGRVNVRGTVRDASTGDPIGGGRVNLQEFSTPATTSRTGEFSFTDVPAGGPWTLSVSADGFGQRFVKTGKIPDSESDVVTLEIALQPAGTVLITLRSDTGNSVVGEFMLTLDGAKDATNVAVTLRTDDQGQSAYRSVVPGRYRVGVVLQGYATKFIETEVRLGDNPLQFVLTRTPNSR